MLLPRLSELCLVSKAAAGSLGESHRCPFAFYKMAVEEASRFNGHTITMTLYLALRVALGYGLSFSLSHVSEDHTPT